MFINVNNPTSNKAWVHEKQQISATEGIFIFKIIYDFFLQNSSETSLSENSLWFLVSV